MRRFVAVLICAIFLTPLAYAQTADFEVDVVVYGGTSGGVIAAYSAKMYGKSVLLVEPGRHLGGMSSGGLGQTDIGNKYAVTGLALDFYRRVGRTYGWFEAWQFEPRVAEQVFESYVDEADVEILFSRRLAALDKEGTTIRRITLEYAGAGEGSPPLVVAAKQWIDASYEGDLMAAAGASYVVGREANSVYGETINGVQLFDRHQFPDGIDPYVVPGDPSSGLVAEITGVGVADNGTGDAGVQAYNFRMSLCRGGVPIAEPDNYAPDRYELLLRRIAAEKTGSLNQLFIISGMPNGKTDWNNRGGFSTDYIGKNWSYPEATHSERAEIWKEHEDYQKGLIYFIGHDPRMPSHLRDEMLEWGYCRDEFLDTGGWPHQLYVREARRLVGEYVMTEHNSVGRDIVDDGIGLAAYTMDSHNVQRVVVDGMVKNEGNVEVGGWPDDDLGGTVVVEPYPIAYRSITPQRSEVTNLLVPVALSASHIAFGSIRMEPVYMVLGQAAAVAASMAIDAAAAVQEIDVAELQRQLRENPLADGSTPEILVDDLDEAAMEITGTWERTSPEGKFGLTALRHDGSAEAEVRFLPAVEADGTYDVYLYWPRSKDLATNVPVEIGHAGGVERLRINMREPDDIHGGLQHGIVSWVKLGTFDFASDASAYLSINADGVDGSVFGDAVLFVPAK